MSQTGAKGPDMPAPADGPGARPELADVGRLARRLVRRAVSAARAEEGSIWHLLTGHLGPGLATLPVASGSWPPYDQVNVQAGLDAWLAEPGRAYRTAGLTQFHHTVFGLADLTQPGAAQHGLGLGSVSTDVLPSGPGGATLPCVQCALYLVSDEAARWSCWSAAPRNMAGRRLHEMDGLGADLDVTFLLTTNRADLLEPALAQRPGRVDHAALLPLPDGEARHRLLRLYQGNLDLDLAGVGEVITRTEGVTASFLKELLRRAALNAAEGTDGTDGISAPLRVTGAHLSAALDELLDAASQLTRVLLGATGNRPDEP